MSHIHLDPDEYETVVERRACSCNGKCDGRCNGMLSIGQRRRPWADVMKIKAARRRQEEDEILARAIEIKRSRGETT